MLLGGSEHLDTMSTLKIFLSEFWSPSINALAAVSVYWFFRRSDAYAYFLFVKPKGFGELAGYPKEEQRRLLHEASMEAFRHWRSLVPLVIFAFFFATGVAVAHTIPKVTPIPDSWWVRLLVVAAFAAFGCWLVGALQTRYVRPFLRAYLERSHHAS